ESLRCWVWANNRDYESLPVELTGQVHLCPASIIAPDQFLRIVLINKQVRRVVRTRENGGDH
ncbi:hypothetical protein J6590_033530, partial [Homalodisca vitripennis]